MRTLLTLILLFPLLAFAQPAERSPANETLVLEVGEERVLHLPDVKRLALGDPRVADIQVTHNQTVVVSGLSAGETTLLIWQEGRPRYQIRLVVR
jgi:pilus assembly protein CpaC